MQEGRKWNEEIGISASKVMTVTANVIMTMIVM
jgi:hypothetical protein